MMREWKEFDGGPTQPRGDRMYVTLNKRGIILINRKIFAAMGAPAAARLLYDARNQTIGVQPAGITEKKAFPLKVKDGASHRFIHAWPFCRHFKIRPAATIRFTDPQLDHDGILLLSLHEAIEIDQREAKTT